MSAPAATPVPDAVPRGRSLRIWHVNVGNHAGPVDGVAVVATELARAQADLGHDVRLVMAAGEEHHPRIREAAGPSVALTLTARTRSSLAFGVAALSVPAQRPDVVHLHSVFRPAHRVLAARARRHGVPVVLSPHSGLAPTLLLRDRRRKALYGTLVERRFHRGADGVHALQRVERDDVVRYAGAPRPVEVIANPVDRALLAAEPWRPSPAPGRPEVVLLCRYDVYQKGLDRVAALARLLPGVGFRVHGTTDKNGPDRARALIAAAPANLRFEPPVYGDDKLRALRGADAFLQPSRVEGLSIALAEAMTLGVPCAVSTYVGRSLTMDEAGTALVLDDDPGRAAGQLAAFLGDTGARTATGRSAARYAAEHFAPEAVAARHVGHYRRLIGPAGP